MPKKPRNYAKMPKEKAWQTYQQDRLREGGQGAKMAPKSEFMRIHFGGKKRGK